MREINEELTDQIQECIQKKAGCEEDEVCDKHEFPFMKDKDEDEDDEEGKVGDKQEPLPELTLEDIDSNTLEELFEMDAEFVQENSEIFSLKANVIKDMWVEKEKEKLKEKRRAQQADEERKAAKRKNESDDFQEHEALS